MMTGPDKIPMVFMMFTGVLIIVALDMLILGDETKQKALN